MIDLNKRIIVSLTDNKLHGMMKSALDVRSVHPQVYLESRLDGIPEISRDPKKTSTSLKSLLMMFPDSHMIVTNYPKSEVGDKKRFGFEGDENSRFAVLQYCADYFSSYNNVNYLTVELEGFRRLNRDPLRALVLVAKHFFEPYDSTKIEQALKAMKDVIRSKDAEIAKVAALTATPEEVADFRRLTQQYSREMPLIAVPMGSYDFVKDARIDSFHNDGVFGTFAKSPKGKEAAPGQPTIEELINYRIKS